MSKILYYICGWESLCWWDNAKTDNYMTPEKENSQRSKGRESQAGETAGSKTLFGLLKEFKEKKKHKTIVSEANNSKGKHERSERGGTSHRIDNTES